MKLFIFVIWITGFASQAFADSFYISYLSDKNRFKRPECELSRCAMGDDEGRTYKLNCDNMRQAQSIKVHPKQGVVIIRREEGGQCYCVCNPLTEESVRLLNL